MSRWAPLLLAVFFLSMSYTAAAEEATPSPAQIVSQTTVLISFDGGVLGGPGAGQLIREADAAQFVILIESHNDHVTPLIAADLFRQLHRENGFNYLAIEQDPFGMEAASSTTHLGQLDRIAAHARMPQLPLQWPAVENGLERDPDLNLSHFMFLCQLPVRLGR